MISKSSVHVLVVLDLSIVEGPDKNKIPQLESEFYNTELALPMHLNRLVLVPSAKFTYEFLRSIITAWGRVSRLSRQSRKYPITEDKYGLAYISVLQESFRFDLIRVYTSDGKLPGMWLAFQSIYPTVKVLTIAVQETKDDIQTPRYRRHLDQLNQSVRRLKCLIQKYL